MGKSIPDLKSHWADLQVDTQQKASMSSGCMDFSGWSPELDARLRGLKDANMSWKTIAAELEKPASEVKARWAVLTVEVTEEQNENEDARKEETQPPRQHKRQVSFASPLIMPESVSERHYNMNLSPTPSQVVFMRCVRARKHIYLTKI
jgi:hypothetical protein